MTSTCADSHIDVVAQPYSRVTGLRALIFTISLNLCMYSKLLTYVLLSLQVITKLEKKLPEVQQESFPHVCPTVDEACEVPIEHLTLSPKFQVTIYNLYFLLNFAFSNCTFQRKMRLMRRRIK